MIDCISSITPYLTLTQSFSSCRPQCLLGERRNAGRMGERSGEAASRDFLALTRIGSCGDQDLRPTVSVLLTVNVALPPVNSLRFTPASGNSKRGKSHDCNCHRIRLQRFPSYSAEVGDSWAMYNVSHFIYRRRKHSALSAPPPPLQPPSFVRGIQ